MSDTVTRRVKVGNKTVSVNLKPVDVEALREKHRKAREAASTDTVVEETQPTTKKK